MKQRLLLLILLCWGAATGVAGQDISPSQALKLQQQGVILPMSQLLRQVRQRYPGELLNAELERDDGIYEYELKILNPQGQVWEIEVNAQTGAILEVERDD
ncbi:PepSY domain-containing protein [Endozoicomonas sp. SM1973]|uniref:PepSY domain-containing protein n=1 Tax=Spartinivicinus marinus TaxID=2994442 RepID=A0A853I8P1_9GAMM|nr:PepSY domain-containing protein [Spartinivicinus marinus]MCX4029751.1 PepSY domain-containing protein [Spartinivicinus marinus]NYZ68082.1 PepSY domain-containing protein [Spartinivicinus marinus]